MAITVRPMRTDDPMEVAATHAILADARHYDTPDFPPFTLTELYGRIRYPWPGERQACQVAETEDGIVGAMLASLPTLDNNHLCEVLLVVRPTHRRRGIGRALVAAVVDLARTEQRTTIVTEYVVQRPGGEPRDGCNAAFAEALGAAAALPETRRRLDIAAVPDLSELRREASRHSRGYTPVTWVGPVPSEFQEDVARLGSRLVLDAPMGDLNVEPERYDVARIQAADEIFRLRGRRMYYAAIQEDASKRIVAYTSTGFDADVTTHAWQQITIVDPAHRGHRLGLLVKLANLDQVLEHESALRQLNTWNAQENARMIAINEAIGFRPIDDWISSQLEI